MIMIMIMTTITTTITIMTTSMGIRMITMTTSILMATQRPIWI